MAKTHLSGHQSNALFYGTTNPIANFEAGSNYQQVQDPAIQVILSCPDSKGDLIVWTTTPWTLPANLAVCVAPDLDYALINLPDRSRPLWIAKERIEACLGELPYEVIDTIKGQKLVGLRYIPLFNSYSSLQTKGAFTVLSGDFITLDQGTGLVHAAPAFGEDDHRICQLNGIMETPCPIDDAGVFTDAVSELRACMLKMLMQKSSNNSKMKIAF